MKTRHATIRAAIGLLAAAAVGGCAGLSVEADWNAVAYLPPLPPSFVEVAPSELPGICRSQPAMLVYGCAKRDYAARTCVIYTGPKPQAWLLDHERKHCAGWDHDGVAGSAEAPAP